MYPYCERTHADAQNRPAHSSSTVPAFGDHHILCGWLLPCSPGRTGSIRGIDSTEGDLYFKTFRLPYFNFSICAGAVNFPDVGMPAFLENADIVVSSHHYDIFPLLYHVVCLRYAEHSHCNRREMHKDVRKQRSFRHIYANTLRLQLLLR